MPIEYTEEQKRVFSHPITKDGVVRAGPGTGKSSTVVELACRLGTEFPAARIKFITFTRAATTELAKKIIGIEALGIRPSTMHSFAMSVLMRNQDAIQIPRPLRIASESEWSEVVNPYLRRSLKLERTKVDNLFRLMASMWQTLGEETSSEFSPADRSRFQAAYKEAVRLFRFTHLDELPDLLRRLIHQHNDAKGLDIDFMIVDEYQDLNKCEIELLKLLRKRGTRVLAVGDEDQSIYSRRKAHPIGIRDFASDFSGALAYDLTICHRCPAKMLVLAQHVINQDLKRSNRPLPTPNPNRKAVAKLLRFETARSEAEGVATLIHHLVKNQQIAHEEVLVLTRTDKDQRFTKGIKEKLATMGVPVFDVHEQQALLETDDCKLLLAYLRLVANSEDSLAWYTILCAQPGIGEETLRAIAAKAAETNSDFATALKREVSNGQGSSRLVKAFHNVLAKVKDAIDGRAVAPAQGWGEWIITEAAALVGVLVHETMQTVFKEMDSRIEGESIALGFYLSQIAPTMKDMANEQRTGVRFMSMAGSKGLTAQATFIVGVDDDLVPFPKNHNRDEEIRLLYVAMTRAENRLVMTWARRRAGNQAHSGRSNVRRRNYTDLLQGGPIESTSGEEFVESFAGGTRNSAPS